MLMQLKHLLFIKVALSYFVLIVNAHSNSHKVFYCRTALFIFK